MPGGRRPTDANATNTLCSGRAGFNRTWAEECGRWRDYQQRTPAWKKSARAYKGKRQKVTLAGQPGAGK